MAQSYYIPQGGLDLVSPPLALKPGAAREALNFEVDINLGYRRVAGYSRLVGNQPVAEMDISVAVITMDNATDFPAHVTIYGATSRATMVFRAFYNASTGTENAACYVTNVSGQFVAGERIVTLDESLDYRGNLVAVPAPISAATPGALAAARATAQTAVRNNVTKVGINDSDTSLATTGVVLGCFKFNDEIWALRESLSQRGDVAFCKMRTAFSSTNNDQWDVSHPISVPAAGARFQFIEHNFFGQGYTKAIYGVSGTGPAFSYDGTTWDTILTTTSTSVVSERPKHIAVHKNRLVLAVGSSLFVSAPGDPDNWDSASGAFEAACGAEITGLLAVRSSETTSALLVATEDQMKILYGDTASDFDLRDFRDDTGATRWSLQLFEQPVYGTTYGITTMQASDAFGAFASATVSEAVKPLYKPRSQAVSDAMVVPGKNQYRMFFNDKTALYVTMLGNKPLGIMPVQLAHRVTCSYVTKDESGQELILFGAQNGHLYKMDSGTSFDDAQIPYHIAMAFDHHRGPRVRKHYRRAAIEIENDGYTAFSAGYDLDYGNATMGVLDAQGVVSPGYNDGPFWDGSDIWDGPHRWDGAAQTPIILETPGDGENIAIRLAGQSDAVGSFRISGVILHYEPRRSAR